MRILAASHNLRLIESDTPGMGRVADTTARTIGAEINLLRAMVSARWIDPPKSPTLATIRRYAGWRND